MWTTIKGNLVNLDNVTGIYRVYNEDTCLGVDYVGLEENGSSYFKYDTKEERDQEFDRLERLLLNERSW
jgi:hypothetical protein